MSAATMVRSLITPHDQTLRKVFNSQKSYFIDIYQREYKWTDENVNTLLNDIEVRFQMHDLRKSNHKEIQEDVLARFDPYFLNTYLTHATSSNTSIVDGQQRLTTLLLILIKLYRILKQLEEEPANDRKTFSSKVLAQLIFETNDFGDAEKFKIFNENREEAFRSLIEGKPVEARDETGKRISENYAIISGHLDRFLGSDTPGTFNIVKLTYYIAYLLDRISIVEIRIERQDNVAMIFEVVNNRGLGLKPYEILKGKLIGSLPEAKKERANRVWTELQEKYFAVVLRNTTEKTVDLDLFFRTFFRSKFADTQNDYEKFEGDYQYEMYRNARILEYFGGFQDKDVLFKRITEDLRYYADLYLRLRTSYDEEYLIYNKLLDQNQQYLLLLSHIGLNDPEEREKVKSLARKFDQVHVILRLLDAYESNEFQRLIYPLNAAVRGKTAEEARKELDKTLIGALEVSVITPNAFTQAKDLFEYERFKGVSNKWLNFSKYVLMRIDRFLAQAADKPSFASTNLEELEGRFNRTGNKKHGMHLEHIYTQHAKNKALFTHNGVLDESNFNQTRNLFGMVLLLKDKHNLSSNDEIYVDKCDTYSKSNLIWNELLVGHFPNVDVRLLPEELRLNKIEPTEEGVFPRAQVDERQKAVFKAIKLIWGSF